MAEKIKFIFFLLVLVALTPLGFKAFAWPDPVVSNGPRNLSSSPFQGGVLLQWEPAQQGDYSNPAGYQVFRAASKDGPFQQVGMVSFPNEPNQKVPLSYMDQPGAGTWYYEVTAFNIAPAGESGTSNESQVVTMATPTLTPTPTISPTPVQTLSGPEAKVVTTNSQPAPTPTPTMEPFFPNISSGSVQPLVSEPAVCGANPALGLDMMLDCSEQGLQDRTWYFIIANNSSVPFTISSAGLSMQIWVYESQLRCTALTGSNGNIYNSSGVEVGAMVLAGNTFSKNTSITEFDESSTHKANQYGIIPITYQSGVSVIPAGGWMQGFAIYETAASECGNVSGNWDNFADDYSGLAGAQTACNGNPSGPYYSDHHFVLLSHGQLVQEVLSGGNYDPQSGVPPGGGTCTPTITPTSTKTKTPTYTPTFTKTFSVTPSFTATKTPTSGANTATFTKTLTPTFTNSITPTKTPTLTPTNNFTNTKTSTTTRTPTNTPTKTLTNTVTKTFTIQKTPTATRTKTPTPTPTNSFTITPTSTITSTPTATPVCAVVITDSAMTGPTGLGKDQNGNLYEVESFGDQVQVFGPTGNPSYSFNGSDSATILNNAVGLAVDIPDQEVFVADSGNDRVVVFNYSGTTQNQFGTPGAANGQFNYPMQVALQVPTPGTGSVYVADSGNNRIEVFTTSGNFTTYFGGLGSGLGELDDPVGVAIDSSGNVYVSDWGNNRVEVFNSNGRYLNSWGSAGSGPGQFNDLGQMAIGIAPSGMGQALYVIDAGNDRVQVFTLEGQFLEQINGTVQGPFGYLTGIYVSSTGQIYVSDLGEDQIDLLLGCGNLPTPTITPTPTPTVPTSTPTLTPTITLTPVACESFAISDPSMDMPYDTGLDASGNIYEVEPGSQQVQVFNSSGAYLRSWNSWTVNNSTYFFGTPRGLAIGPAPSGTGQAVYITDAAYYQVDVFDLYGNPITQWSGSDTSQFINPGLPAVGPDSSVYVPDQGNHRVLKFTPNGTPVTQFTGNLSDPEGVALDSSGFVYVTDSSNSNVEVFKPDTTYLTSWSAEGLGAVFSPVPIGISVGDNNLVYVADEGNEVVNAFTTVGGYQGQTNGSGTDTGPFTDINGLFALDAGHIYVADEAANRLVVLGVCAAFTPTPAITPQLILPSCFQWAQEWSTSEPIGLAASYSDGSVYSQAVSSCETQRWKNGNLLSQFSGNCNGYVAPGIALDKNGSVYRIVNHRVQVYSPPISLNSSAPPTLTFGSGYLNNPQGIAVGPVAGQVFVTDAYDNTVKVFTTQGVFVKQFGNSDNLYNPDGIARDEQTDLTFVVDEGHNRIVEYHNNQFLLSWSTDSKGVSLNNPTGIALDGNGAVYVTDTGNNRVLVFENHGQELMEIDGRPGTNGNFSLPVGLASDGVNLYVADTNNNRIMKFVPCTQVTPTTFCERFVWEIGNVDQHVRINPSATNTPQGGGSGGTFLAPRAPSIEGGFALRPSSGEKYPTSIASSSLTAKDKSSPHEMLVAKGIDHKSSLFHRDTMEEASAIHRARLAGTGFPEDSIDPPQGAAVGPDGLVYVSENTAADLAVFGPAGYFVKYIVVPLNSNPLGVAASPNNTIAVALEAPSQVEVFPNNGNPTTLGSIGTNPGYFTNPQGVAFDSNNNLYVADTGNNRIQVFNGTSSSTRLVFGTIGSGPTQFNAPTGVAVDSQDNSFDIFVADSGNNRVQKFDSGGTYLLSWGSLGPGPGQFSGLHDIQIQGPLTIAGVVHGPWILTSEDGTNRVQAFDLNGNFNGQFIGNDSGGFAFQGPRIGAAPSGEIYVAEAGNVEVVSTTNGTNGGGNPGGGGGSGGSGGNNGNGPSLGSSNTTVVGGDIIQKFVPCGDQPTVTPTVTFPPTPCVTFDLQWNEYSNSPESAVVDPSGNIYVAETLAAGAGGRVTKFSSTGLYEQTIGSGILSNPSGLALQSNGNLVVADSFNNSIYVFNPSAPATPVYHWGQMGAGNSQFSGVLKVATGPGDAIYVSDPGNNRFQVFNYQGNFQNSFGSPGSFPGQLSTPQGIAVDSSGNIYIGEQGTSRVSVFNSSGTFLTKWGSYGTGPGQFSQIEDVRLDAQGRLWVLDGGNNNFQVFDEQGNFLSSIPLPAGPISPLGFGLGADGSLDLADTSDSTNTFTTFNNFSFTTNTNGGFLKKFVPCGTVLTPTPTFTIAPTPCLAPVDGWAQDSSGKLQPNGIAVGPTDNVYVGTGQSVYEFSKNGFLSGKVPVGSEVYQLASSSDGRLAVLLAPGSSSVTQVEVFNAGATLLWFIGGLNDPEGINFDSQGQLWVADAGNGNVTSFDIHGHSVSQFGILGNNEGEMTPYGVAVDSQGNVFVAEPNTDRVSKFNSSGVWLTDWTIGGEGPLNISIDSSNRVWVAEQGTPNGILYLFDDYGTPLMTLTGNPAANDLFPPDFDLAVGPSGEAYVTDFYNSKIWKIFSCGTQLTPGVTPTPVPAPCLAQAISLGGAPSNPISFLEDALFNNTNNNLYYVTNSTNGFPGSSSGILQVTDQNGDVGAGQTIFSQGGGIYTSSITGLPAPTGIGMDTGGNLYLAEQVISGVVTMGQVQKFSPSGQALSTFPTAADLKNPQGVAVDSTGRIYVAEPPSNQVRVLNADGTLNGVRGGFEGGTLPGELNQPFGVALDSSDNLYVVEEGNNRVTEFDPVGNVLQTFGTVGSGAGQFNSPTFARWAGQFLYVSDSGNSRVELFDGGGNFIYEIPDPNNPTQPLSGPMGVAVSGSGSLFTLESAAYRVRRYDLCANITPTATPTSTPNGFRICEVSTNQWGQAGSLAAQFTNDAAVAVAPAGSAMAGSVLVWDSSNGGRFQYFTGGGQFQNQVQTGYPVVSLAFNSAGTIFADTGDGTVLSGNSPGSLGQILSGFNSIDSNGNSSQLALGPLNGMVYVTDPVADQVVGVIPGQSPIKFGSPGHLKGEMLEPTGLATDASGNVYVGESGNNRISKFDSNGNFIKMWGGPGKGVGQLSNPRSMAISPDGLLWVAEAGNNRIQVFDENGTPIAIVGGPGNGLLQFSTPFLAWGTIGNLYVADSGNDRVQNLTSCAAITPTPVGQDLKPDLTVSRVDLTNMTGDWQTEQVGGTISAVISNIGEASVTTSFNTLFFEDENNTGVYVQGTDPVLGAVTLTGLAFNTSVTVTVAASGQVKFRDNLVYALVDSGNAVTELNKNNNTARSGINCNQKLPLGPYNPTPVWTWSSSATLSSFINVAEPPVVADLTGSGVPDVIFNSFAGSDPSLSGQGALRAISGANGSEIFTVTDPNLSLVSGGQLAVGDLDGNGQLSIIGVEQDGMRLLAFNPDGSSKWRSQQMEGNAGWGAISVADLFGIGQPNIVVGRQVFQNNGTLLWTGKGTGGRGATPRGPFSLVADLNGDGNLEVVAGNTVYNAGGTILWQRSDLPDGVNAVGRFNPSDPHMDVALVSNGQVWLLDHLGNTLWGPQTITGGGLGGPPIVADVDGSGVPSLGVAGANYYTVFSSTGAVRWQKPIQDAANSYGIGSSTAFDFTGNGASDILYRDQNNLWILHGSDGRILNQIISSSGPSAGYPVVADVDGSGYARILVPAGQGSQAGIYAFGESQNAWVDTRRIWNEYGYHVTNVNDDGRIPREESLNPAASSGQAGAADSFNSWRQNLLPNGCLATLPDLTASFLRVNGTINPPVALGQAGHSVTLTARIGNGGMEPVSAGVSISFYDGNPANGGRFLAVTQTALAHPPGGYEDLSAVVTLGQALVGPLWASADDNGRLAGAITEVTKANNLHNSLIFFSSISTPTPTPPGMKHSPITVDLGANYTLTCLGGTQQLTAPIPNLQLRPLATGMASPIGIDYEQVTGQVLASVNYATGVPFNFDAMQANGLFNQFSQAQSFTSTVKFGTARGPCETTAPTTTTGGFNTGDIFCSTGIPGRIARLSGDGTNVNPDWEDLPGESTKGPQSWQGQDLFGGFCVDQTGLWNGDLFVSCWSGDVWEITSKKQATLLCTLPFYVQDILTLPNDPVHYGPWAGKLLICVPCLNGFYTYDHTGKLTFYSTGIHMECVNIIQPNMNFYSASENTGTIWGAPAGMFTGMTGNLLTTQEYAGNFYQLSWNGPSLAVSLVASVPGVFECSAFAPVGMGPVPPVLTTDLSAAVTDTDLAAGATLSYQWAEVSGPGPVTFSDPNAEDPSVAFPGPGTYDLSLMAFDGVFNDASTVTITVPSNGVVPTLATPTFTPTVTSTATPTPTGTLTPPPPTSTATQTPTSTATFTPTSSGTPTFSPTLTFTPVSGALAIRIKAGADKPVTDQEGVWLADQAYYPVSGGGSGSGYVSITGGFAFGTTDYQGVAHTVQDSTDPNLYTIVRENGLMPSPQDTALEYKFDVPPGNYQVTVKSWEYYFPNQGERIFSLFANPAPGAETTTPQTVFSNLDMEATCGEFFACDHTFLASVTLSSDPAQATAGVGTLDLQWTAQVDMASVAAIEVLGLQPQPTPTATRTPVADSYEVRLDAGSDTSVTDSQNNVWSPDQAFTTGSFGYIQNGGLQVSVPGAGVGGVSQATGVLYDTYYENSTVEYQFTVAPGNYEVGLDWAELDTQTPGDRLMNVLLNGNTVITNLDLVTEAGYGNAYQREFLDVPVTASMGGYGILDVQVVGQPSAQGVTPDEASGQAFLSAIQVTGEQNLPTATFTATNTATPSPTGTSTNTPLPTATPTGTWYTSTATNTFTNTVTNSPTVTPSPTQVPLPLDAEIDLMQAQGASSAVSIDGAVVTNPVTIIGTANGNLQPAPPGSGYQSGWFLYYSPANNLNVAVTIASGTSQVSEGVLGVLDPTLMLNGAYVLQLAVVQADKSNTVGFANISVEGNMKVGNFTLSFTDLNIPVSGIPMQVIRTYDSRNQSQGDFGIGWTLDFHNIQVEPSGDLGSGYSAIIENGLSLSSYSGNGGTFLSSEESHFVDVVFPNGKTYSFEPHFLAGGVDVLPGGHSLESLEGEFDVQFEPLYATAPTCSLVPLGSNGQPATILSCTGDANPDFPTDVTFGDSEGGDFNPTTYLFTDENGNKYIVDTVQGLEQRTDLNGNTLKVDSAGVHWVGAKSGTADITFTRDSQSRITQIKDPVGNLYHYTYDTYGNLSTYQDPAGVAQTQAGPKKDTYTYNIPNQPHYLVNIQDPLGDSPIKNLYDASGRLTETIDSSPSTIFYNYNLASNSESVTDQNNQPTSYVYDNNGNILQETQYLNGTAETTTYTYSQDGYNNKLSEKLPGNSQPTFYQYSDPNNPKLVSLQTDPLGYQTSYTYDNQGHLLTTRNPNGHTATNTYNAQGNLATSQSAEDQPSASYSYDANGNLSKVVDPAGIVTTYANSSSGSVTLQIVAAGLPEAQTTTYTYDGNGNRTTQTVQNPSGSGPQMTTNSYDGNNRLVKTLYPDGTNTQTVYDSLGHVVNSIDQKQRFTNDFYDPQGRPISIQYPDGRKSVYQYDANGNKTYDYEYGWDNTLLVTHTEYDSLNHPATIIYPDNSAVTSVYDGQGRVTDSYDENGHDTHTVYDQDSRAVTVIAGYLSPLGSQETDSTYDGNGNQTTIIVSGVLQSTTGYDSLNRPATVTPGNGQVMVQSIITTYDSDGRKVSQNDLAGQTTYYAHDGQGRLTKVTDALGNVTSYTYDQVGNELSQKDANLHTTTYAYDTMNRRISRQLPGGQSESFGPYDHTGNLTHKTTFRGDSISYSYNFMSGADDVLTGETFPEGSISYDYDGFLRRKTMTDTSGSTSYTYTPRSWLNTKAQTINGISMTLSYGYDNHGNLTSIASSNSGGTNVNYSYDALNRPTNVSDTHRGSNTTTYSYDGIGNLSTMTLPNGDGVTYQYDTLNRLNSMAATVGGSTISSYSYTLGPAGNRINVSALTGRAVTYLYDPIYRLNSETISGGSLTGGVTYSYDNVGNRTSRTSTLAGLGNQSPSYNPTGDDRMISDGTTVYSYDDNGSVTQSGSNTFTFDSLGQMTQAIVNGVTSNYTYDGDGNKVQESSNGTTRTFLIDTKNLTGYAQVMEVLTGRSLNNVYTYGSNRISEDQLISGTWNLSFYGYDGTGSVRYLTNSSGTITDTYDYDAFGTSINQTHVGTPTPNEFLYDGEQLDGSTGFYNLRARWMNPGIGRFQTMDSFEGDPQSPASLHKYTFANNNPVNDYDPSGHESLGELSITVAAIGVLSSNIIQAGLMYRSHGLPDAIGFGIYGSYTRTLGSVFAGGGLIGGEVILAPRLMQEAFYAYGGAETTVGSPASSGMGHREWGIFVCWYWGLKDLGNTVDPFVFAGGGIGGFWIGTEWAGEDGETGDLTGFTSDKSGGLFEAHGGSWKVSQSYLPQGAMIVQAAGFQALEAGLASRLLGGFASVPATAISAGLNGLATGLWINHVYGQPSP